MIRAVESRLEVIREGNIQALQLCGQTLLKSTDSLLGLLSWLNTLGTTRCSFASGNK